MQEDLTPIQLRHAINTLIKRGYTFATTLSIDEIHQILIFIDDLIQGCYKLAAERLEYIPLNEIKGTEFDLFLSQDINFKHYTTAQELLLNQLNLKTSNESLQLQESPKANAEIEPVDKSGLDLTYAQIALICIYNNIKIKEARTYPDADLIANKYGKTVPTSGIQLYGYYNKLYDSNDRLNLESTRSIKTMILNLNKIINEVNDKSTLEKELQILKNKL